MKSIVQTEKQYWVKHAVAKCLEGIEENEGWKEVPYLCPAGKWTIGFGLQIKYLSRGQREILGMPEPSVGGSYTREEIKALPPIEKDKCWLVVGGIMIRDATLLINKFPWMLTLDTSRAAAFLDMAYNMGVPRLCKFEKTLKLAEDAIKAIDPIEANGLYKKLAAESLDSLWAKQVPNRALRNAIILEG